MPDHPKAFQDKPTEEFRCLTRRIVSAGRPASEGTIVVVGLQRKWMVQQGEPFELPADQPVPKDAVLVGHGVGRYSFVHIVEVWRSIPMEPASP